MMPISENHWFTGRFRLTIKIAGNDATFTVNSPYFHRVKTRELIVPQRNYPNEDRFPPWTGQLRTEKWNLGFPPKGLPKKCCESSRGATRFAGRGGDLHATPQADRSPRPACRVTTMICAACCFSCVFRQAAGAPRFEACELTTASHDNPFCATKLFAILTTNGPVYFF